MTPLTVGAPPLTQPQGSSGSRPNGSASHSATLFHNCELI
jgi:hypothetical protein